MALLPFEAMTALLPWWWRWAALAALAFACTAFGWFKGSEHWHTVLIEERVHALQEGVRIQAARNTVTTKIETIYVPKLAKAEVITETITKEVPYYVANDARPLGAGFRELHDAAADMRLPVPSRIRDGAPVTAQDVASTVAANYGVCHKDQLKLQELQDWIRAQQKVR